MMEKKSEETEEMKVFTKTQPILSLCQVLLGGILVVMGIVAIAMECALSYLGMPFYGGIFAVISGVLGWKADKYKTSEKILAALVLSFLSALICSTAVVIVMALAIDEDDDMFSCWDSETQQSRPACRYAMHKRLSVDSFILMIAVFETFVASVNGILYSRIMCCHGDKVSKGLCGLSEFFKSCKCCQPTQVYVVLSQSDGSMQIPVITMPTSNEDGSVAMVPVNFQEMHKFSGKHLQMDASEPMMYSRNPQSMMYSRNPQSMMYSRNEDIEIAGSESSPLIK